MLSSLNRLRFFMYMLKLLVRQTLSSRETNRLARTVSHLAQLHLTVMFVFVIAFSPLPEKPSLIEFLVFWSGSYAGALGLYRLANLVRPQPVRAHWISSQK